MKTLIVEDDLTCRILLQEILKQYGTVHVAINGKEAVQAASMALEENAPYELICMDIRMPEMCGNDALKLIRKLEEGRDLDPANRAKIIMTTALSSVKDVLKSYYNMCDAYLTKPIDAHDVIKELLNLNLIEEA